LLPISVGFFRGLLFGFEDGSDMFFRSGITKQKSVLSLIQISDPLEFILQTTNGRL
jgi:hypothetical protein